MTVTSSPIPEASIAFLNQLGWTQFDASPVAGDASSRAYFRLTRAGGERAILMIAPPARETPSCPKGATREERIALGYNAQTRLAGPNLNAFITIASLLRDQALSAPAILGADPALGLALIEDLGDDLFARAVATMDEKYLYENAIDVLLSLRTFRPANDAMNGYDIFEYDAIALQAETNLLIEWYWPLKHGRSVRSGSR